MFKYDKQTLQSSKGHVVGADENEQKIKKSVDASGKFIIKETEDKGQTSTDSDNTGNIDKETDQKSPDKSLTSDVKIHAEGTSFVHSIELGDTRLNQYRERLKELVNP